MSEINLESTKPSETIRQFICVDYPGLVENESEAIRTLGGMNRIEQTFQRRNHKLFLNFNPDNIFFKMLCSTTIETSPQLLTSSSANKTNQNEEANDSNVANLNESDAQSTSKTALSNELASMPCLLMTVSKKTLKTNLIGRIDKIYTFNKIADFQYLPMSSSALSKTTTKQTNSFQFTAFYDNFRFNLIDNYEHDLRKSNIPQLFVLPPFFSRFDDPVNYAYRSEPVKREQKDLLISSSNDEKTSNDTKSKPAKQGEQSHDESAVDEATSKSSNQKDESSSGLIRSMRQERTSLAFLVTYNCKQIPTGNLI